MKKMFLILALTTLMSIGAYAGDIPGSFMASFGMGTPVISPSGGIVPPVGSITVGMNTITNNSTSTVTNATPPSYN